MPARMLQSAAHPLALVVRHCLPSENHAINPLIKEHFEGWAGAHQSQCRSRRAAHAQLASALAGDRKMSTCVLFVLSITGVFAFQRT